MRHILSSHLSTPASDRETALRARYDRQPETAWVTHLAWTEGTGADLADTYRGAVRIGLEAQELTYALERRVGGPEDDLRPRDFLCAAVASCLDSSIRLVAARLGVSIARLVVMVTGDVDARGVLGDPRVPVGFQSMRIEVQLRLTSGTHPGTAAQLLASAQHRSVLLQTLRGALPIEIIGNLD